jgi:hypothetical protein
VFSDPPFYSIILFRSTALLTRMTGISLRMQWPLTSQLHGSVSQREQLVFLLRIKLQARIGSCFVRFPTYVCLGHKRKCQLGANFSVGAKIRLKKLEFLKLIFAPAEKFAPSQCWHIAQFAPRYSYLKLASGNCSPSRNYPDSEEPFSESLPRLVRRRSLSGELTRTVAEPTKTIFYGLGSIL